MKPGVSKPNDSGRPRRFLSWHQQGPWAWAPSYVLSGRHQLMVWPATVTSRRVPGIYRWMISAILVLALASPAAAEGETCATASDCRACPAGQHPECVETEDPNFLHCVCKDGAPGACAAGGGGAGGAAWGLALLALLPWRRRRR